MPLMEMSGWKLYNLKWSICQQQDKKIFQLNLENPKTFFAIQNNTIARL